jgi:uncharacterized protein (TIGR02231 family)
MKSSILSLMFLIVFTQLFADESKIKSKIESVTVFQSSAQINRVGNTAIKAGRTEIIFSQLAMTINPQTIQVSGIGDFTILGVYHRLNYLEVIEASKRLKELQDSVKLISKKIEYLKKDINVYTEEANLIKANKTIGGQTNGLKVTELEAAANFYRRRLQEIFTLNLDLGYKINEFHEIINRLNGEINNVTGRRQEAVSEIVVEIIAEKAGPAKLELSYTVNNAYWVPEYDIRAIDINKPIELHARALIFQNTGEDWENVILTVSTGNPNQSGVIPSLYTWYLNYRNVNQQSGKLESRAARSYDAPAPAADDKELSEVVVTSSYNRSLAKASNSSNYTQVVQSQTQTKYEISIPYNVPSSNKQTHVKIQKYQLNASYRYYSVPKLDQDVFLQARITGWEELSLVPGDVNIFFEGTYVTKAYLNPQNFTDTLDISLGRDKSIVIKRELVKDNNAGGFIGSKKRIKKTYNISIRNTKNVEIPLIIEDQVPLSRDKEVEVEILDKSGAKYDELTGKLSWEFVLKPKTTEVKKFSFQVKYPKELFILNL